MPLKYIIVDVYKNKIVGRHFTLAKARVNARDIAWKKHTMLYIFEVYERVLPTISGK